VSVHRTELHLHGNYCVYFGVVYVRFCLIRYCHMLGGLCVIGSGLDDWIY
jgi:hypothetical protein